APPNLPGNFTSRSAGHLGSGFVPGGAKLIRLSSSGRGRTLSSSKIPACYDHHVNVYNTLSGAVETIEPSGRAITLYVCGITPYDTTHLGHAFTYTVADVFVRH